MADQTRTQLRLADLPNRKPTHFDLAPDAAQRSAIAADLGLNALKKLRFTGQIAPAGKRDWTLTGELGATAVQDCGITLAPVTTRLDEPVQLSYVADYEEISANEIEMPEDDTVEPLPDVIDLVAVMTEALSLALPAFPRAEDAELGQVVHTKPGTDAMTDDDAKPFAGLGDLRAALQKKADDTPS